MTSIAKVLILVLLAGSLNACTLLNPPVLDRSKDIESQVDAYYKKASIETAVLSGLVGGGLGALACRNSSGGVIAACAVGGAAVGAGIGYTAFSALSDAEQAKKSAREADRVAYLEQELNAERDYLRNFKRETLGDIAALREEVKAKKSEIAAGARPAEDLQRMKAEIEKSRESIQELLAARKDGMEKIEDYCGNQNVDCSQRLIARRNALQDDIVRLERQVDNQYALVQKELDA